MIYTSSNNVGYLKYAIQRGSLYLPFKSKAAFEAALQENDIGLIFTTGETFTISILENLTLKITGNAFLDFGALSDLSNITIESQGNVDLTCNSMDISHIRIQGAFTSTLDDFTDSRLYCEYFYFGNNLNTSNYNGSYFVCFGMIIRTSAIPTMNFNNVLSNCRLEGVYATCSSTAHTFINCQMQGCQFAFYNNSLNNVATGLVRFTVNNSTAIMIKNCTFQSFNNQTSAFFATSTPTQIICNVGVIKPTPATLFNTPASFRALNVTALA